MRRLAVAQLEEHPDWYSGFVLSGGDPADHADYYAAYVARMTRLGEWGDHVTLQAVSDRLGVEVALVTSFEESDRGGDAVVLVTPRAAAVSSKDNGGKAPLGEERRTLWLCAQARALRWPRGIVLLVCCAAWSPSLHRLRAL